MPPSPTFTMTYPPRPPNPRQLRESTPRPPRSALSSASHRPFCHPPPISKLPQTSRPHLPRHVFLPAALHRLFKQPFSHRFRTLQSIISFILDDVGFWFRRGIWQVRPTLRASRLSTRLPIHPNIPVPAFDVYIPVGQEQYLLERIAATQCVSEQNENPKDLAGSANIPEEPVVMYVHGGAWGSGQSWHFAQIGQSLADRAGVTSLVLSYRLYPEGRMEHQVADVTAGLRAARWMFPGRRFAVLAHSSGAHVVATAVVKGMERGEGGLVDVVVLTCGIFDLGRHFVYEGKRGVAEVSPMLFCCNAEDEVERFAEWSPSAIVEKYDRGVREFGGVEVGQLEGDLVGKNLWLPDVEGADFDGVLFPKVFLMVGSADRVVPMHCAVKFAALLRGIGVESRLLVYNMVDHVDFVLDWFKGETGNDFSDILDVGTEELNRREKVSRWLGGSDLVEMRRETKRMNSANHIADVLRILRCLKVDKKNLQRLDA